MSNMLKTGVLLGVLTALFVVIGYALGEAEPPWRRDHRWWKYVEQAAAPAS